MDAGGGGVRVEGNGLPPAVIVEAAEGYHGRPGGHGAGVVMAAFGLVPGVTAFAVETKADVFDGLDAFGHHTGVDELRGYQVFNARPGFGVVGEWDFLPNPLD